MLKPLIGITCDYDTKEEKSAVFRGYYSGILESGGLPFLIPNMEIDNIYQILLPLDGLLFTGGPDVEPEYFRQTPHPSMGEINPYRDNFEIALCREAMERDLPILGICRGMQLINIAMGGDIYQDLKSQWDKGPIQKHNQDAPDWYGSHLVEIEEGSILQGLLSSKEVRTNSFHHQAVNNLAPCFMVSARCGDGVVEAIESKAHTFALGVQWHPERMWERDERMLAIFRGLVNGARSVPKP